MLKPIGRCTIDIERIRKNMPKLLIKENKEREFRRHIQQLSKENALYRDNNYNILDKAYSNSFPNISFWNNRKRSDSELLQYATELFNKEFQVWVDDVIGSGFILKCVYTDETMSVVTVSDNQSSTWLFPKEYVTITEYKDYEGLSGSQRHALLSGNQTTDKAGTIATLEEKSKRDIVVERNSVKSKKKALEDEIADVNLAKNEELAKMKAEIDRLTDKLEAKKAEMLSQLEIKKAEMEEQLEQLNNTIFRLDSEIYAIRCYTGEILELKRLKTGKSAPSDIPLVFYQKLRYLDEELGKIVSIYDVDFNDVKHFEKLLTIRQEVADTFAPSERSLMLVRVSKNNITYANTRVNANILEAYEKYHGLKVAIILRDGENLYIAWTDDDRIAFSNNAFYKSETGEATQKEIDFLEKKPYESEKEYKKRIKKKQKKNLEEQLGRYFIFSIMQGLIDREIIKFPEKTSFINSPYIIKSYADGWLTTDIYGSFDDMITRCNSSIKKGDFILTVQSLHPEYTNSRYSTWENSRGRGDKNRTHDVAASDCTIYPINYIEHYATYEFDYVSHCKTEVWKREYSDKELKENQTRSCYRNFKPVPDTDRYEYFISLEKEWSYSGARANFAVYSHEFINLTFMNSVWLEYVITNQKTSGIRIGGETVDYAYLLPYLKLALQHVRERENKVKEWISKVNKSVLEDTEWPVKLSEWMLENEVHNFSEFRVKQFVKSNTPQESAIP